MLVLLLPMASICAHCSLLGCRSLVPVDVYQMCCLSAGFQRASLFAVCENLVRTIILDLKFNLVPFIYNVNCFCETLICNVMI